jgi:hypothetical protein
VGAVQPKRPDLSLVKRIALALAVLALVIAALIVYGVR